MSKGDDALIRRKNKVNRKRMRASRDPSSVSARVAGIIAAKRRRKAGKRRICEGMCFSLPTPEDPFNDRHGNKRQFTRPQKEPEKKSNYTNTLGMPKPTGKNSRLHNDSGKSFLHKEENRQGGEKTYTPVFSAPNSSRERSSVDLGTEKEDPTVISKFLIMCLKTIQDSWPSENSSRHLLASKWGVEFWKCCFGGSDVVDESEACASMEQVAWVVSTASDIIVAKEKKGVDVPSPFLLYVVPSQSRAVQVRAICKPLKVLGIHAVSLHSGASIEIQINGLNSCEPELIVSTPERLLELVSLGVVDISQVSLLVLDGIEEFSNLHCLDKLKLIREKIPSDSQSVLFSKCSYRTETSLLKDLVKTQVHVLSSNYFGSCPTIDC